MLLSCVMIIIAMSATAMMKKNKTTQQTSDEELMLSYIGGELRAFEELYKRHRKPVYNFILRYVKAPEKAEELLQEVFLRLVQSAKKYEKQAKFTTWLYTIARNLCIDTYRRGKNRQMVSMQQSIGGQEDGNLTLEHVLDEMTSESKSEEQVFYQQLQVVIEEGVANLPEKQREVFLLREVSHLSYKEIAQVVDTLENTVKSRMRYALEFLRNHLEAKGFTNKDLV